jgi:redox-sensitive bicupin YhaK (pirin superfamily)
MQAISSPLRLRPDDHAWEQFPDPHGRPTTPVRILHAGVPFVLEADFPAGFRAGLHWHPHDTIYVITAGALQFGDEGWFRPGDVRWVRGGHSYGPELAGPDGVRFHLVSLGGPIGLNWSDLYGVPAELAVRLATFDRVAGRLECEGAALRWVDTAGARVRTAVLAAGHPYAVRALLAPGTPLPERSGACGTLAYLRHGALEGDAEELSAGDLRLCVAPADTAVLVAGPAGADVLLFGLGGAPLA